MKKNNPLADNAGYVTSRICRAPCGGDIVIYDRANGADYIDADDRWIVMHEPSSLHISLPSRRAAYEYMKLAAEGYGPEIYPDVVYGDSD